MTLAPAALFVLVFLAVMVVAWMFWGKDALDVEIDPPAPGACPPCSGNCNQGRDCPALKQPTT